MTTIEQDIREAYKGILNEEQIEATIKWWGNKEEQAFKQGRIAGLAKAVEIIRADLIKFYEDNEFASVEECFYVARDAIEANIREERIVNYNY